MIELGKTKTDVRPIRAGGTQPPQGSVFVGRRENASVVADVMGEKKVVLETKQGRLELTTTESIGGSPGQTGTYLNGADYAKLGSTERPTIRLYGLGDTWRKIRSGPGLLLVATTILAVVTAGTGLGYAIWGKSGTSAGTVAVRAQTAITWALEPANDLATADTAATTATIRELRRRSRETSRCLAHLRGDESQPAKVPGVKCELSKPPAWQNKENAGKVSAALGALVALLGTLSVRGRYGFGKDPVG